MPLLYFDPQDSVSLFPASGFEFLAFLFFFTRKALLPFSSLKF